MFSEILKFFARAYSTPEVRKKIFITALVVAAYRLVAHVPAAGVDVSALKNLFSGSPLLSLLDFFSGGTLANFSIMALGIQPYITASIIFQLLMYVIPSLKELYREGEYGQTKVNQYMRLATLPIALMQGVGTYFLLSTQGVIPALEPIAIVALISTMVAGSMLAIWMGELITEYGVKNGISFLIFAGIIAQLPVIIGQSVSVIEPSDYLKVGIFLLIAVCIVGLIVFINEAVRKVPIHYAKTKSLSGLQSSYLPLKLNQAGVIPIIFAVSLVLLPSMVGQFLGSTSNPQIASLATKLTQIFDPTSFVYNVCYFLLIVGFTYFYTSIAYDPKDVADSLKRTGGFIPGIRPGVQTRDYISFVLNRITLVGAIFLGLIAILPSFFQNTIGVANLAIGGTGILIVVSVVLELTREIESQLVMKRYDMHLRK
ncbi:MAG: preprotein translocase subunit SecY [Patescibacteria group bacterium]|nr:preprotein translocase subunit SecY [Patescibacteria group bacterium]